MQKLTPNIDMETCMIKKTFRGVWKYAMMRRLPELAEAAIDLGARDLQKAAGVDRASYDERRAAWIARFCRWRHADDEMVQIRAIIAGDRLAIARIFRGATALRKAAHAVGEHVSEDIIRAELADCGDRDIVSVLGEVIIGAIKARRLQFARELLANWCKRARAYGVGGSYIFATGGFAHLAIAAGDTLLYEATLDYHDDSISISTTMEYSAIGGNIEMFKYLYGRLASTHDRIYVTPCALCGAVRSGNVKLFGEVAEIVMKNGILDREYFEDRYHMFGTKTVSTIESLVLTVAKCAGHRGTLEMCCEVLKWAHVIDREYELFALVEMFWTAHDDKCDNYNTADFALCRIRDATVKPSYCIRGTSRYTPLSFSELIDYSKFCERHRGNTCCSIMARKYV